MKKSTLLSYLTAATVITTTAGTFAVWDTLTAKTQESTVRFRNPVTITLTDDLSLESKTDLDNQHAEGTVSFTLANYSGLASSLKIKPVVSVSGNEGITADKFNFEIIDTKSSESDKNLKYETDGFVDRSLESTTYTVKVSPKDTTVVNEDIKIQLTAELKNN